MLYYATLAMQAHDEMDVQGEIENLADWLHRIPKVELHLHIEGAIPLPAMWELVQKYGGDPSAPTLDALAARFRFTDFQHFIEAWVWKNRFLREYDDFSFMAEAVARDLARQNIRYAEAFFSPTDHRRMAEAFSIPRLLEAIRIGLSRVPEVEVALIPDLVRDYGPERALDTLAQVNEAREFGVIGIGIGGGEHRWPPELFTDAYERAREMGFRTTAHAGEVVGPESVWGAVRSLKVDRIGHGTRAGEDERLLDYLAERQLPLEMCPLSNVATRVVDSIEHHPVRRYFERGLLVTVNTDDPMMFGNSLAEEYRLLMERLGFSRDDIHTLILNGIRASWLPEERKREMIEAYS